MFNKCILVAKKYLTLLREDSSIFSTCYHQVNKQTCYWNLSSAGMWDDSGMDDWLTSRDKEKPHPFEELAIQWWVPSEDMFLLIQMRFIYNLILSGIRLSGGNNNKGCALTSSSAPMHQDLQHFPSPVHPLVPRLPPPLAVPSLKVSPGNGVALDERSSSEPWTCTKSTNIISVPFKSHLPSSLCRE
jgi:hypothetical protein